MAERTGVVFMRTTREKTPILYEPGEEFRIGGARVVRRTDDDAVTLVGAGITLHEALKAADALAAEGVSARVIDLYSLKPIDTETILAAARDTAAIVTVEDHWPEGGIGDAVLDALAGEQPHPVVVKLAVREMPGSGTPAELLHGAGIDADCIADAVRTLVRRTQHVEARPR
jgi:transketolase